MKRVLALCGVVGALLVVGEDNARACSPPEGAPAETLVRMTFQGPDYTTPKNIGLILSAFAGPRTGESGVIAQAQIDVKSAVTGAASPAIPGTLRRLETQDNTYSEYSIWAWSPSDGSQLAPGKYSATINFLKAPSGSPATTFEFNVEDRVLDVPRAAMTLEAVRWPEPDPSAPVIQCKMTIAPLPCGGGGGERTSETQSIPSRQRGAPRLNWQSAIPNQQRDFPFLRMSARAFSRMADGVIVGKEEKRSGISLNGAAVLTKADQYCVETTSWLVTNPASKQVVEQCAPHGSLDLSISDAEQTTYAERVVQSCSRDAPILFPPGHTKDDPAGVSSGVSTAPSSSSSANEGSGESGCSTGASTTTRSSVSAFALIALMLCGVRRRRRRGVGR